MPRWEVPADWPGETVFIIGGGPSVETQPLERLRGRNVIVINSAYLTVSFAQTLFFGDRKWWDDSSNRPGLEFFKGCIVSIRDVGDPRVLTVPQLLQPRHGPLRLSTDPRLLAMWKTSFSGAINLACHRIGWCGRIVLLGADGKKAADGRTHHYPRKKAPAKGCWDRHHAELRYVMAQLRDAGISIVNASPGTAWADLCPVVNLMDVT
jgi:hypothetical protein